MAQYRKPPAVVSRVANPLMRLAVTRLGIRPGGMLVLQVQGRTTGRRIRTPLNPVEVDGGIYLFSPRGESQWVRNVRAAGGRAEVYLGRRQQPVLLTEIADPERKLAVMREYLRRFYSAVGRIVEVPKNATDEQLRPKLGDHPIFLVEKA